ncbi:MAG: sensor histidine kinase [Streptosporangiaceae bacterium]
MGNLLANVQAHTPPGTAAVISAAESDGIVTVVVSDDGPGVPPDRLPRIFERFYRADAPSSRPGSGLGLAIVAAVASAHDGKAEVTLADPHGLRITVTFPPATSRARPGQLNLPRPARAPTQARPPAVGPGLPGPARPSDERLPPHGASGHGSVTLPWTVWVNSFPLTVRLSTTSICHGPGTG